MKQALILAVALGFAIAGSVPAWAQTATDPHAQGGPPPAAGKPAPKSPGMGGMGMMQGGGMQGMQMGPGKHIEGRLAFLRAEIGITGAQTPVWNAFADSVRKASKDMAASMPMHAMDSKGDWLSNLERREKAMTSHAESLRAIRTAAQPLYAALSEEQKRTANELMAGPMGPMGAMGPMMRM